MQLSYRSSERETAGPEFDRYLASIGSPYDDRFYFDDSLFSQPNTITPSNVSEIVSNYSSTNQSIQRLDFEFLDNNNNDVADRYEDGEYNLQLSVPSA